MKLKEFFKKGYQSLSVFGAVIFFTYGGQKLANLENICNRDQNKFFEGLCYAQKVNSKIYSEINFFIGTVKLLYKGTKRAPRWASSSSLDRFKEYNSGFDFSYDAKKGINKGFFLLSRIDPDFKVPKVELWDLTQQSIIHTWQFNIEDIRSKIKINDKDWEVLRFLHPLLLEDGSIVTHIQPENDNTQLLKFDYCGNLTKIQADKLGYHHSIEIGDKNRLYVPIARVKEQSKFYENYKKFPPNFRNEGIAILNTDLVLEKVIPLDEIFDSIGLLSYVNSRFSDFKNLKELEEKFISIYNHHNVWIEKFEGKEISYLDDFEIILKCYQSLSKYIESTWLLLKQLNDKNKKILFEGAQGFYLDLDHGTYPYVTSSNTVPSNASTGSGANPKYLKKILGITKAYTTRVGNGPFPTEENNDIGEKLGKIGNEFGTVTGRKRRCGWLDILMLKKAITVSGINGLVLTKLDVLDSFRDIKICTSYKINNQIVKDYPSNISSHHHVIPIYETLKGWEEKTKGIKKFEKLPLNAQNFVKRIETLISCNIDIVSTGPERDENIVINEVFS